ncbi:hypothetical protein FKP32DRAFT_1676902 [Trametes sanguinea]|nr:hypothetical protein FKP32DRAFT_1676902 [Trametes sanguinea]
MYIRSDDTNAPVAANAGDALCPPHYPACDPSLSAGPALANINAEDTPTTSTGSFTTPTPGLLPESVAGSGPAPAKPQSALAARIQHIGQRNLIGIVVVSVFVCVGLVLWLSYGKWPRAGMRRIRERFRRGDKQAQSASGLGASCGSPPVAALRTAMRRDRGQPQLQLQCESEKHDTDHAEFESSPPCSPQSVEVEVESLGKHAGAREVQRNKVPRVHFA